MTPTAITLGLLLAGAPLERGWTPTPRDLPAVRTSRPPTIDGRLDDPAWSAAPVASDFTQRFPDDGKPASEKTEVRVLYDDDALYIAFRCYDAQLAKVARYVARRDTFPESDWVWVSVDSMHDHQTSRAFTVNAAGTLSDAFYFNDAEEDRNWDAIWEGKVAFEKDAWTVELALPMRVLHHPDAPEVRFGLNLGRYLFRRKESSIWVFTPRTDRSWVSRFGHLDGLRELRSGRAVELTPYAAGRFDWRPGTDRVRELGGTGGLDARWNPLPQLSLDATLNPDFGQVEADPAVLNLSSIETFYPEKRPFFLEGAHLFNPVPPAPGAMPLMQQFYSRRVGRTPPSVALGDDETEVGVASPARIAAAAKLVGRSLGGWNIALLDAWALEGTTRVRAAGLGSATLPAGSIEDRRLSPPTNYAVARAQRELSLGTVGGTLTSVRPFESAATRCGDGRSPRLGRCANAAETGGLDWTLRPGEHVVSGQLVASHFAAGPERALPDGTHLRAGDTGLGGQLRLARENGKNWLYALELAGASPRLELNDAGYLPRQNMLRQNAKLTLRTVVPHGLAREAAATLMASALQDAAGQRLAEFVEAGLNVGVIDYLLDLAAGAWIQPSSWDNRLLEDGGLLWRPPQGGGWFAFATDTRRVLALRFEVVGWKGLDDAFGAQRAVSLDGAVIFKPTPSYEATLQARGQRSIDSLRLIETDAGGYTLSPTEAKETSLTLRQSLSLSTTLSLQAYAQLFLASGIALRPVHAATSERVAPGLPLTGERAAEPWFHDASLNITAVVRWEFARGSTAFLVYQRAQAEPSTPTPRDLAVERDLRALSTGRNEDVVMLKVAYWLGL